MTTTRFLHRQAQALEHVLGYRTEGQQKENEPARTPPERFTIALEREAGTPALEVAQEVGRRLGWAVHDRELPLTIARQLHQPAAVIEEIDERGTNWLRECLEALSSRPATSESCYFRRLSTVIHSLGDQGRCVIVGRGAGFILPPDSTLRVRLVGRREDRIAALARAFHLDRWSAARKVEEVSRERIRFIRDHFHLDPGQARNYDLVLNCSQWPPADCADFILQALYHKAAGHRTG